MARIEKSGQFKPAHLARWLETTRYYLFTGLEHLADSRDDAFCTPALRSHVLNNATSHAVFHTGRQREAK